MALQTQIDFVFKALQTSTNALSVTKSEPLAIEILQKLGSGTGSRQADLVGASDGTIATGTPLDIDLKALTDEFGAAVNMAEIVAFVVINDSATAGETITVGAAASNAWVAWLGDASDTIKIGPGGMLFWQSPIDGVATDATHKVLRLAASAASVAYRFMVVGRSA